MNWPRRLGFGLFIAATAGGSWLAADRPAAAGDGPALVADLHVHPFPGDGALTIRQLQREAARRGVDVIAVTGHNNQAGWRLANAIAPVADTDVIVLPGQEVTNPRFHIVAVGIPQLVQWDQDARAVIAQIHALGGAAIAAHPVIASWQPRDPETLALLDGVEVAHPAREEGQGPAGQIDALFAAAQGANPAISAVGSSDFHMAAPLGRCRTYIFADEWSAPGIVRALRAGQTVAEDTDGRLFGPAELVRRVTPDLRARRTAAAPTVAEKTCALVALLGLALLSVRDRRPPAQLR